MWGLKFGLRSKLQCSKIKIIVPGVNEGNNYTWASLLEQKLGGFVLTSEKINIKKFRLQKG